MIHAPIVRLQHGVGDSAVESGWRIMSPGASVVGIIVPALHGTGLKNMHARSLGVFWQQRVSHADSCWYWQTRSAYDGVLDYRDETARFDVEVPLGPRGFEVDDDFFVGEVQLVEVDVGALGEGAAVVGVEGYLGGNVVGCVAAVGGGLSFGAVGCHCRD